MYEGCPRSSWTPAQHSFIFQKIRRLLTQNIFKAYFFFFNQTQGINIILIHRLLLPRHVSTVIKELHTG